jgi:hypothetical protein
MITLPIAEQTKQKEWKIMFTIARHKGSSLQIIHNLKNKLMLITHQTKTIRTQIQHKEK